MASDLESTVTLSSGGRIPVVGLGVASTQDEKPALWALEAGYRHLDTAQVYFNEKETGAAVKTFLSQNSSVSRSDLFVCSKLWHVDLSNNEPGAAIDAGNALFNRKGAVVGLDKSLDTLGLDYVDLYLLHTPKPGPEARVGAWLGLQECVKSGKTRAIGVSNWSPKHIDDLMATPEVTVLPAVNQVEFHPWNQQKKILQYCQEKGIVVVAYSPLTQGRRLGDPVIGKIAQKHGKSAAQVVLRWCLQMGAVIIPKSVSEKRIRENADVFGWELDAEDMKEIEALDEGQKGNVGEWDPFAWA